MGWLGNLRRRRAAKAYVFKLGPWRRRAYGASPTYTADLEGPRPRPLALGVSFSGR
jgi:hypothetical protein